MKKALKMEELCCANCAAKMEVAINKIPGVKKATINFMAQKLVIDAEDGMMDEIVTKAQAIISRIEPDCVILL